MHSWGPPLAAYSLPRRWIPTWTDGPWKRPSNRPSRAHQAADCFMNVWRVRRVRAPGPGAVRGLHPCELRARAATWLVTDWDVGLLRSEVVVCAEEFCFSLPGGGGASCVVAAGDVLGVSSPVGR